MTDLAEYNAAHPQPRARTEEGYVDIAPGKVKKWRGNYHVYVIQADGKYRIKRTRIIAPCSEMTKAEAREEHRVWLRRNVLCQPAADAGKRLVESLCDDYMKMREGDWGEDTRATNRAVFEGIIKPAIGKRAIGEITADDLKTLLNALPSRIRRTPSGKIKKGTSQSYTKKTITHLRGIFDLAHERDLITKNPARSITIRLTVPKGVRKPNKSTFPPEHLTAYIAQLSERDRLIFLISLLGGTRPNELFAIIGKNVGPNWVLINRALSRKREVKETKKEEKSDRFIGLPPETAKQLHHWIKNNRIGPKDLVFQNGAGKAISRENFLRRNLRGAAKRTEIEEIGGVTFQMLRRSFATIAKYLNVDPKAIQAQMGHARLDMSMVEYAQPVDAARIEGLGRMEDVLLGRTQLDPDTWAKLGTERVQ